VQRKLLVGLRQSEKPIARIRHTGCRFICQLYSPIIIRKWLYIKDTADLEDK
jgi:hypothetical protein